MAENFGRLAAGGNYFSLAVEKRQRASLEREASICGLKTLDMSKTPFILIARVNSISGHAEYHLI
jgi:hypothetical protein